MDDTRPSIAIIGAGPIGIEAALYGRYLGYPVTVYEQGDVCEHVRRWGHVKLFSPFGLNSSSLGLSALAAQDPDRCLPGPDQLHTGQEWVDSYLQPVANSDLIRRCIKSDTCVESIARDTSQIDEETTRQEVPFRLLVRDENDKQSIESADIVIDATGTWGNPNPLGLGGMPALGEQSLNNLPGTSIWSRRIPDLREFAINDNAVFLVVGSGYSAATNVVQINELQKRLPGVRCFWITRSQGTDEGPMNPVENDPLEYRAELSQTANRLTQTADWLDWRPGCEVTSITFQGNRFQIVLSNDQVVIADHVLANTGYHGNYGLLQGLQIHQCYASGGPMAWAASVAGTSGDCLQQQCSGPDALRTTEENFYIIGSKSYGTDPRFLFSTGLQQIRDVFKIIADRNSLDLYATLKTDTVGG